MKRITKQIFSVTLCVLLLLSMLPAWALGVSDETRELLNNADMVSEEEYLIGEGTLEFLSQSASSNGIYINFVSASDGTVRIDLLELDYDYHVIVYENDWWLTSFNGTDAPDSIEFPVQADGQYSVIFSVVEYHTETLDAWLPVAGSLTYRMSADVPVSDVIQLPHEDSRKILEDAYALEEGMRLSYGATLTGQITSVKTPYDSYYQNISVVMEVPGCEDMPVLCYRLAGEGADILTIGDTITVSGNLVNYYGTIEFEQGCTLIAKDGPIGWGPDSLAIVGDGLPGINAWDPADPAGDMTEVAPYFYQLTLECPANTLMRFKFAGNDMWDDEWDFGGARVVLGNQVDLLCGPGTSDMTLQVDEACTLLFTVDLYPMLCGGNAMLLVDRVNPIGQPRPLVVNVPSSWTRVYAYTWEPESFGDYPGRELQKQDDYYWEAISSDMENLVLTGLKKDGSYQHTDDISLLPGYDTVTVTVYDDGAYDVSYDEEPIPGGYDSITIAGSGLPGITEWNPEDVAGDMIETADNVYQKILNFTAPTTICFRIVADHDWFNGHAGGGDIILGQPIALDSTAGSPDFQLDIPEACQLKFTVDLNTGSVDKPGTLLVEKVATRKITVKAPASWIGVDAYTWDPESLGSFPGTAMQKNGDVFELMVPETMVNLVLSGMQEDGIRQQHTDMQLEPGTHKVTIDISNDSDVPIIPEPILSNYRVVGNAAWMGNWDAASDLGRMIQISENVYQKHFVNVEPGSYELKITKDGKWDNAIGNVDGSNIAFLVVRTGDVIVTYNEFTRSVDVVVDNDAYAWKLNSLALMGEGIPGVPEGDYTAPEAQMTEVAYNVFEKTLNVSAGTSMFFWLIGKDNRNTGWDFGGQIITLGEVLELNGKPDAQPLDLYITEDCQVKITVDLNPMLSGGNATLLVEKIDMSTATRKLTIYVPDTWGNICIYTWEPESLGAYPGQQLQKGQDGFYGANISTELVNLVISGTLADGASWHTGDIRLQAGYREAIVLLREDFTYSVVYDNTPIPEVDVFRVVGSTDWMGMWDPASDKGLMEETSVGVYQKRFENVQPGSYEFKITRSGKWDDAIGTSNGDNFKFNVSEVSDVVVICAFDAGDLIVSVDIFNLNPGDVTGDGKLNLGDVSRLYAHVRGNKPLTDADALRYADFNGDGKVNIGDVAGIYTYVRWYDPTQQDIILP